MWVAQSVWDAMVARCEASEAHAAKLLEALHDATRSQDASALGDVQQEPEPALDPKVREALLARRLQPRSADYLRLARWARDQRKAGKSEQEIANRLTYGPAGVPEE